MNKLQKALKANALFSSMSGILLILFNCQLADLFGVSCNTVFWIVGLILIYFSGTICYEIEKQRHVAVIWIIIQDFTWVLGSFFLLLYNPYNITLAGNIVIGFIALIVLVMALNQIVGLKNTFYSLEN